MSHKFRVFRTLGWGDLSLVTKRLEVSPFKLRANLALLSTNWCGSREIWLAGLKVRSEPLRVTFYFNGFSPDDLHVKYILMAVFLKPLLHFHFWRSSSVLARRDPGRCDLWGVVVEGTLGMSGRMFGEEHQFCLPEARLVISPVSWRSWFSLVLRWLGYMLVMLNGVTHGAPLLHCKFSLTYGTVFLCATLVNDSSGCVCLCARTCVCACRIQVVMCLCAICLTVLVNSPRLAPWGLVESGDGETTILTVRINQQSLQMDVHTKGTSLPLWKPTVKVGDGRRFEGRHHFVKKAFVLYTQP